MPRLRQVIKGIRVQAARAGKVPCPRLPITPSILRPVWLQQPTINSIMLWVACTTTFFGFCRSGEVTVECESKFDPQVHLSFLDLAVDNALAPQVISIKLKRFKSDQFMKRVTLVLGRTNDNLCPVTALLTYLSHRGNSPGPLFC